MDMTREEERLKEEKAKVAVKIWKYLYDRWITRRTD